MTLVHLRPFVFILKNYVTAQLSDNIMACFEEKNAMNYFEQDQFQFALCPI